MGVEAAWGGKCQRSHAARGAHGAQERSLHIIAMPGHMWDRAGAAWVANGGG